MEIKAIIVEDELPARETLEAYLEKYCPEIKVVATASNIDEAIQAIRNNNVDLLFLDIELPYGNAFDLIEKVGKDDFEIVFITAYSDYAIEALNKKAAYYIMKPLDIEELIKAVEEVKNRLSQQGIIESINKVKNFDAIQTNKFMFPHQFGFDLLEIGTIIRCEGVDNYTRFHFTDGSSKLISKTLKKIEEQLSEYGFMRVHKSNLVNLRHILSYHKGKTGSLLMSDKSEVMIASGKKNKLVELLGL
ncbi:MAG: response regulator transcription factor [Bacteroidetes bacterium]|nr:response regulator transcription factor [Bacteroidota bacterium]MBT4339851.1 response regulator transcription factor [Bacteroidota bacterium]MBT4969017.1 response regulator transcription factor [Bacteroidota bacterium]